MYLPVKPYKLLRETPERNGRHQVILSVHEKKAELNLLSRDLRAEQVRLRLMCTDDAFICQGYFRFGFVEFSISRMVNCV